LHCEILLDPPIIFPAVLTAGLTARLIIAIFVKKERKKMAIQINIKNPKFLENGIWLAQIPPNEVMMLGTVKQRSGTISIIMLPNKIAPLSDSNELVFEPSEVQVLNLGKSENTAIIFGGENINISENDNALKNNYVDDNLFKLEVKQLPQALSIIGLEILRRVRRNFGGHFEKAQSGKFINRWENFWTIKVQPKDKSYSITVYGEPEDFNAVSDFEIKEDQRSYSRFKVSRPDQMEPAWNVIQKAAELKNVRKRV